MEKKKKFIVNTLYYGILLFLLIIVLFFLYRYCLLVIVSFLTASLIRPLFWKFLHILNVKSRFIHYFLAAVFVLICYTVLLIFLGLVLYAILRILYFLPECITDIYNQLLTYRYLFTVSHQIYSSMDIWINKAFSQVIQFILQIILNLTSILTYAFFHFVLTILFIVYNEQVIVSEKYIKVFTMISFSIKKTLKILLKTYSILFLITFICLWIGFSIMNLDNSFVIAFLIALFDFFPVLGLDMILIPWIIICVFLNQIVLSLELLILYILIVITRNILEPKLISKQVRIPVLPMFVVMIIMMKFCGILGLLISPLLFMTAKDLHDQGELKTIIKNLDFK